MNRPDAHGGRARRRPSIGKVGRGLPSDRCFEAPGPALLKGVEEFNRRLFFEQHETLEEAWIEEDDPVRYLYQGILQIGVGFYHLSRGNFYGAARLMERGMELLQPFAPACMGVDVAQLLAETDRARAALVGGGPGAMAQFDEALIPCVRFLGGAGTPPDHV